MTPTKTYLATLRQEAELAASKKERCVIKAEYLLELLDLIEGYEDEVGELLTEMKILERGGSDDE